MKSPSAKRARRVAVVLSGCGAYDGSEVQEAVVLLLALERAGVEAVCFAPNVEMPVVINHASGHPMIGEHRNALVESARIARGDVRDLARASADGLDAAVLPGGYGATRVLCDHARAGRDARVLPEVERFLRAMHAAKRPLGFLCMAPVVGARVFGSLGPSLGTGRDATALDDMAAWGARAASLGPSEVCVDREQRFACAAAFTATRSLAEAAVGVERLVRALLELA